MLCERMTRRYFRCVRHAPTMTAPDKSSWTQKHPLIMTLLSLLVVVAVLAPVVYVIHKHEARTRRYGASIHSGSLPHRV